MPDISIILTVILCFFAAIVVWKVGSVVVTFAAVALAAYIRLRRERRR